MRLLGLLVAASATAFVLGNCVSVSTTGGDDTGGAPGATGGRGTGGRADTGGEPGTGGELLTVDGGLPPVGGRTGGKATGGKTSTGGGGGQVSSSGGSAGGAGGAPSTAKYGLHIQYPCQNTTGTTNSAVMVINLINDGPSTIDLTSLTLRYWFTADAIPLEMQPVTLEQIQPSAFFPKNIVTIKVAALDTPLTGADSYMEFGFRKPSADAGVSSVDLGPGGSIKPLQIRWQTMVNPGFMPGNDYSCDPTATGTKDNKKLTAYIDGTLIWGTEPS